LALRAAAEERGGGIRRRNRALILAAAERVFAEKGFDGATTAAIAAAAGLPKANVHYYFPTKEAVYRAVIDGTLRLWLSAFDHIAPEDDPAEALAAYVRRKMRHSFEHPLASRVFALEVIRGAPVVRDFLAGELRAWVEEKGEVIRAWVAQGRMAPVEPAHLFFAVWAATQTYADFDAQITAVLGRERLTARDREAASEQLVAFVLRGCGLAADVSTGGPSARRQLPDMARQVDLDEAATRRAEDAYRDG
jgi:TetR/AcrR family transcriptional regulator